MVTDLPSAAAGVVAAPGPLVAAGPGAIGAGIAGGAGAILVAIGGIQVQINGMQAQLTAIETGQLNLETAVLKSLNASARLDNDALTPLRAPVPVGAAVVAGLFPAAAIPAVWFPRTRAELTAMTGPQATALLAFYGMMTSHQHCNVYSSLGSTGLCSSESCVFCVMFAHFHQGCSPWQVQSSGAAKPLLVTLVCVSRTTISRSISAHAYICMRYSSI